ncbi:MAG: iron-sulfur cluster assembly accessory protein [Gammaproteobacteria bacterium]
MNAENLITLTSEACSHIHKWLVKQAGLGLRLSVKKTGCSGYMYVADIVKQPMEGDIVIHPANTSDIIIYIAADCVELLKGTEIDYVAMGLGPGKRLVFNNPNVKGLCGCGESFTID